MALGLVLIIAALGLNCSSEQASSRPLVIVSIPPLAGLVEQIAGERVEIEVLVGGGQSPHTFEPTPTQVIAFGRAGLYLCAGLPFEEQLLAKIEKSAARLEIADVSEGIERRVMEAHDHGDRHDHDHHVDDPHDRGAASANLLLPDPHVWMSPVNLTEIARQTASALIDLDPVHGDSYQANLEALIAKISATHEKAKKTLAPYEGHVLYVFHPAFGYFTDAYGLQQRAVETEGKQPTPKQLADLIAQAKADAVRLLIVQPQFDQRNAQAVASAIGGVVMPVDPLARDVLGEITRLAMAIEAGLLPENVSPPDSGAQSPPEEN